MGWATCLPLTGACEHCRSTSSVGVELMRIDEFLCRPSDRLHTKRRKSASLPRVPQTRLSLGIEPNILRSPITPRPGSASRKTHEQRTTNNEQRRPSRNLQKDTKLSLPGIRRSGSTTLNRAFDNRRYPSLDGDCGGRAQTWSAKSAIASSSARVRVSTLSAPWKAAANRLASRVGTHRQWHEADQLA